MSRRSDVQERTRRPAGEDGEDARARPLARGPVTGPGTGQPTSTARARSRAAIVAIAPGVLLAGFASHPYIGVGPPDEAAIAAAVASEATRWGLSHLMVAVGSGLAVLAFLAIRSYLRQAGEERWSSLALPFIVMGSTLFTVRPGWSSRRWPLPRQVVTSRRPRLRCFGGSHPSLWWARARGARVRQGDRRQRSSEPAADRARRRGAAGHGRGARRPPGRGSALRAGCRRHRGTVAAGRPDVEAPPGG